MIQIFKPTTKVQKDRQIMRDTDARVAKYSRRGLVLNFLVFILCLAFGDFYLREPVLAIVLVTGLLLVTLLRGYYLFRFDTLYARAPGRWRNQYFVASLFGALWWSVILVSLTWVQGMRGETLVMWLYSAVFYSSVSNVFAPYRHFLTAYLFIGQVPAALTAILLGDAQGYLYGSIMLVFFLMLIHQAKLISVTYWERLEANHALRERAQGLENQQRSSQATIELNNEFLVNLGQEFRLSLNDMLGTLALVDESRLSERERDMLTMVAKAGERQLDLVNNVVDFSKITTRSLELEQIEFDVRRQLEKLIQDFAPEAHQQNVELNYLFDDDLPQRVRGDATRLGQILSTLLNHALNFVSSNNLLVSAGFNLGVGDSGELQVIISDAERSDRHPDNDSEQPLDERQTGIGIAICKGLAECLGGSVHLLENNGAGQRIIINISLQVVFHEEKALSADPRLRGKRILLVDLPERIAPDLAGQLASWGLLTGYVSGYEQAIVQLQMARTEGKPVDLVLIYNRVGGPNALGVSQEIATQEGWGNIRQLIAISALQRDTEEVKNHVQRYPQIACIEKPIMRRRLHELLVQSLLNVPSIAETDENKLPLFVGRVLLVEDHRVDQMLLSGMLKKLGCQVTLVSNGREAVAVLEREGFDLVLMDCDLPEQDGISTAQNIRAIEKLQTVNGKGPHVPIIALALAASSEQEDHARCLEAGMDDFIAKPIRFEDLAVRLKRWLNLPGSQEKLAQIGQ